jgi:hypothetical protein
MTVLCGLHGFPKKRAHSVDMQGKCICTLAGKFWILDGLDQPQSKLRNPRSKMAVSLINAFALADRSAPFAPETSLWQAIELLPQASLRGILESAVRETVTVG